MWGSALVGVKDKCCCSEIILQGWTEYLVEHMRVIKEMLGDGSKWVFNTGSTTFNKLEDSEQLYITVASGLK